jgi:three-Cys-motif partner protein
VKELAGSCHRSDDPWDLTERPHTKAKLRLLANYFRRWLVIWNAPKQRQKFPSDWFVIDMFAGRGRYADGGSTISGSPLVYLEQIAALHRELKTNGIRIHIFLVEKKRQNLHHLEQNIEAFLNVHPELSDLVDIEMKLGDCNGTDIWSKIASMSLTSKTPVFMLVDPYGIAIRRDTMDRLVALPAIKDIMFNYMVCGVKRARGIALKPEEQLSRREQTTLATYVKFLGKDVELNEDAESPQEYACAVFVSKGNYVVAYDMDYPDRVGTLYYLLFITKNRKIANMARKMFGEAKKQKFNGQLSIWGTDQLTADITFFSPEDYKNETQIATL